MKNVSIVIGANFGDEGKGVITDALCSKNKSLVVLSNGGPQRAHTVFDPITKKPHIFKHFCSGTFRNCGTYFPRSFIVNPMEFVRELNELEENSSFNRHNIICYRSTGCCFTTPFDMILNQELENWRSRNDFKYGTCGMGIWETVLRYSIWSKNLTVEEFSSLNHERKLHYLESIKNYCSIRYNSITGKEFIYPDYVNDEMCEHFIRDFNTFCDVCMLDINQDVLNNSDNIVFENGQGLLLDVDYIGSMYNNYATPSSTGLLNPVDIMSKFRNKIHNLNIYYVTRPYITRHGPTKILEHIFKGWEKHTSENEINHDNDLQGSFVKTAIHQELQDHVIRMDLSFLSKIRPDHVNVKMAYTHLDEESPMKTGSFSIVECGNKFGIDVSGLY